MKNRLVIVLRRSRGASLARASSERRAPGSPKARPGLTPSSASCTKLRHASGASFGHSSMSMSPWLVTRRACGDRISRLHAVGEVLAALWHRTRCKRHVTPSRTSEAPPRSRPCSASGKRRAQNTRGACPARPGTTFARIKEGFRSSSSYLPCGRVVPERSHGRGPGIAGILHEAAEAALRFVLGAGEQTPPDPCPIMRHWGGIYASELAVQDAGRPCVLRHLVPCDEPQRPED